MSISVPTINESVQDIIASKYPTHPSDHDYYIYQVTETKDEFSGATGYYVAYCKKNSDGSFDTSSIKHYDIDKIKFNEIKTEFVLNLMGYPPESLVETLSNDYYGGSKTRVYTKSDGTSIYVEIKPDGSIGDIFGKNSQEQKEELNAANQAFNSVVNNNNLNLKDSTELVINIPDNLTAARMLDRLTRVSDKRRVEPLSRFDSIGYPHRGYYNQSKYNLQIGDTWFIIPPEFIMITSESQTNKIVTLRQENTQKTKSGYHRRTIMIDLVAHGSDQINGFAVEGPEGTYYMDGIRPLLAQFKRVPFLPIFNELINDTYGIHTVALQSITIKTIENFPSVMTAQITLQEMNMMPYIEMHSAYFQFMIDWDLMRFYYQRALTEEHEYKKLQSMPVNKDKNHFIMRALNVDVFEDYNDKADTSDEKFINIILNKGNYDTWIDSNTDSFHIVEFSCNYSNMLANIQMSEADSPTVQFMGGMDTMYNIVIETTDKNIVTKFEQGRINNDLLTRNNPRLRNLGFVMLESELVEFTGSLFVMIDTITTNTTPGFPGLFHIQITCVAYDIGQSEREQLNGFRPFADDADPFEQPIQQSEYGVYRKITQDLYAEHQISRKMEVYPDLHLPTYAEVDTFIKKCNKFRKDKGITELPYSYYPRQPYNMLHGVQDVADAPGDYFHPSDIDVPSVTYDMYVDPDFYVFYHKSYEEYLKEIPGEEPKLTQRNALRRTKFIENNVAFYNASGTAVGKYDGDIVQLCNTIIAHNETGSIYNSINRHDGNAPSIGKFQWNGSRAINLLKKIISANEQEALNSLGNTLMTEIKNETDWNGKTLNNDEVKAIANLLNKSFAKAIQDKQITEDIEGYVNYLKNKGVNDARAIVFLADLIHQHDSGSKIVQNVIKQTIVNGGTLDAAYNAAHDFDTCKNNGSPCINRRASTYTNLKKNYADTNATQDGTFTYINDPNSNLSKFQMSKNDFNTICEMVINSTGPDDGTKISQQCVMAQCFFDRITQLGSTLSTLSTEFGYKGHDDFEKSGLEVTDSVKAIVKEVFMDGRKQYKDWCIYGAYDNSYTDQSAIDKIESDCTGSHSYDQIPYNLGDMVMYGKNQDSTMMTSFVIEGEDGTNSDSSTYREISNSYASALNDGKRNINYEVCTVDEDMLKYFGEPLIVRNSRMIWAPGLDDNEAFVRDIVNNPVNTYNTSFVNMYQYSARGRLVRAFPTFLFCILDDQSQWYDGKKLWTNYYVYKSLVDIQVHQTNDMPTETAVITITNSANNLSQTQMGLNRYTIRDDDDAFGIFGNFGAGACEWFYRRTGLVIGGIKLTPMLIDLHQKLYNHARLREGARIHLRVGYGSDPFGLAPMINGHISDITLGDQITMVVTSDGHEMIQSITSAVKKDTNAGWLGLFGFGEDQEASNIIAKMMVERSHWLNHLFKNWFEASKYGIEHFGIYFHNRGFLNGGDIDTWNDLWNKAREHWDILMNIYIANYKKELYVTGGMFDIDEENNFCFNKYNMTPWDLTQICTQQVPEYICKCLKHQFDSRLFFGLPSAIERYRYDFFGGEPTERERQVTESNYTTVKGSSLDDGGKFNENANEFDSSHQGGWKDVNHYPGSEYEQIPYAKIKEIKFNVKMDDNHTNSSTKDPDKVTIKLYDKDKNFLSEEVVFTGNLLGDVNPLSLSPVRDDAVYATFHVHVPSNHKNCCKQAKLDWELIYEYDEITNNTTGEVVKEMTYYDILFEECRTAAQAHYLDSMTNIIDNQVRVTNKFSNTNIKCMYIQGSNAVSTKVLHSDDTIDAAYQKTTIVDTPIVQDAFGPDWLYSFFGYKIGQRSAERVGISTLLYGWQQQYQGEIILFGSPGIRPHDYLMVNDVFSNLYGLSVCREVIHSFNSSNGYTTSVTPGMIGFDTKENSGLIPHTQNLLATLNAFAILMQTRLSNVHFIERYITQFSQQLSILNHACELLTYNTDWENARISIEDYTHRLSLIALGLRMFSVCKSAGGIAGYVTQIWTAVKGCFAGVKAAQGFLATAGAAANGITHMFTKGAAAALGLGPVGWFITISIFLANKLVDAVLDWISNKNVVVLMPMYWENYPFVSGVKDGEKILLMDNNSTATEENNKSDGKENPNSPDID